jgi:hypothetical protein
MRVSQIIAIVVFAALTVLAVLSGFASKALINHASVTASSAQNLLNGAYSAVAIHQPNLIELGIFAAVCLIASRLRWKASDRS